MSVSAPEPADQQRGQSAAAQVAEGGEEVQENSSAAAARPARGATPAPQERALEGRRRTGPGAGNRPGVAHQGGRHQNHRVRGADRGPEAQAPPRPRRANQQPAGVISQSGRLRWRRPGNSSDQGQGGAGAANAVRRRCDGGCARHWHCQGL